MPAAIDEIRGLLTITTPIVSSWQKGGDSSIPNGAYQVGSKRVAYDFNLSGKVEIDFRIVL